MCKICVDFKKGSLTRQEAYQNLQEVYNDKDEHSKDIWIMLLEDELNQDLKDSK